MKIAIRIYIEVKKAFDTIDQEVLIKNLGITGLALQWIKSYPKNWKLFVKIRGHQ